MEYRSQPTFTRRLFTKLFLIVPATLALVAAACRSLTDRSSTDETLAPTSTTTPTATQSTADASAGAPAGGPVGTATAASTPAAQAPSTPTGEPAGVAALSPTPSCSDDDDVTPSQTEGPYYTPDTPERASLLEPDIPGTKLIVTGYVYATDCRPVARALLDFWQADDAGAYDNVGYQLRGHQFTDDAGRYQLETIVPGLYPGRTRHIHVKVQAPNRPVLTTQLYFPDEPRNQSDGIFNQDLVMDVQDASDGKSAGFDFVLDLD